MAEWLGSGLQHHLQRFESARYLNKKQLHNEVAFFVVTHFTKVLKKIALRNLLVKGTSYQQTTNPMNKYLILLFTAFSLFYGCSLPDDDIEGNQEEDLVLLQDLFAEFEAMAHQPCTDAELWEFVAYGSKACGGPQGYIA